MLGVFQFRAAQANPGQQTVGIQSMAPGDLKVVRQGSSAHPLWHVQVLPVVLVPGR
ncbi:hypothetical protein D3C81_2065580 [compost metagenome]